MSEHEFVDGELSSVAPGYPRGVIRVRQRIKITQNAKGDYQKELCVETEGTLHTLYAHDASFDGEQGGEVRLSDINDRVLRRALIDADAAIAAAKETDATP